MLKQGRQLNHIMQEDDGLITTCNCICLKAFFRIRANIIYTLIVNEKQGRFTNV